MFIENDIIVSRGLKSNGVYSGGQEDDGSKEDTCWVVMKKNPRGS